jgi:hypothetical protein
MPDAPLAAAVEHALDAAVRAVGGPESPTADPRPEVDLAALLGALSPEEAELLAVAAGHLARRAAYRLARGSRTTGKAAPDGVSSVLTPPT